MKVFTIPPILAQPACTRKKVTASEIIDDIESRVIKGEARYTNTLDRGSIYRPYRYIGMTFQYDKQYILLHLLNTFTDCGVRKFLRHDVLKYVKGLSQTNVPVSILICDKQSTLEYNTVTQCSWFKQLHMPIVINILACIRQPLLVEQQPELTKILTFTVKPLSNTQYDTQHCVGIAMFLDQASMLTQVSMSNPASGTSSTANQVSILMGPHRLHIPFIIYKLLDDFPSLELLLSHTRSRQLCAPQVLVDALLKTIQYSNAKLVHARFNFQIMLSIENNVDWIFR